METFGTFIFLIITFGPSLSKKLYVMNSEFEFDGHKTEFYFTHKGELSDNSMNGIYPMYFKITENSAFYAIFHYNRNDFAAAVAEQMLRASLHNIQTNDNDDPAPIDWNSFLADELRKIDDRLMQDDITGERAESETKALITVVDGYKATIAQIGDMRMAIFAKVSQKSKNELHSISTVSTGLLNVLGGKSFKEKNARIRDVAKLIEFHDFKYIILGTKSLWFLSEDELASKVLQNVNNLKKAAQEITDSVMMPIQEKDNGVIVIEINSPQKKGKSSFIDKWFCCLNP